MVLTLIITANQSMSSIVHTDLAPKSSILKLNHETSMNPNNVEIHHIDDRGCGLFATKAFVVGQEIIRESPVFRVPNAVKVAVGGARAAKAMAKFESLKRFESLSISKQNIVMSLSDAHNVEPTLWGKMQTNCIPMYITSDAPATESGIFSLACRINHACAANARYLWSVDLGKLLTIAMRPIVADEEITVQYMGTYCSRSQRRKLFQNLFNFTCRCQECYTGSAESDKRLNRIKMLIDQVPVVAQNDAESALEMCECTLDLLEVEGRNTPLNKGIIHYDAYRMAMQSSNAEKAKIHIRAAWECSKLSEGANGLLSAKYARMMFEI